MLVVHRDVVIPLFRNVVFREDRGDGAGGLASAAIDAFSWMDVEQCCGSEVRFVLLGMDAVHGAGVNARRILRVHAWFADDVSHTISFSFLVLVGGAKKKKDYTFRT